MDIDGDSQKLARIIWLDLEMTGLDSSKDFILEVAAILTDWDFKEIATYEGVIKNNNLDLKARFEANHEFWKLHSSVKDSLIAQNDNGKSLEAIEQDILDIIEANFDSDVKVILGGNSIHMDRRFITAYMPKLDERLYYRMLDVTAWKLVMEEKLNKKFSKAESHRALEDIRGSIAELEYYLGKVKL